MPGAEMTETCPTRLAAWQLRQDSRVVPAARSAIAPTARRRQSFQARRPRENPTAGSGARAWIGVFGGLWNRAAAARFTGSCQPGAGVKVAFAAFPRPLRRCDF